MDVRMPDGTIVRNVPPGTTRAQLESKLAKRRAPIELPTWSATAGMSGPEKFAAGVGLGLTNVGRGIGQAVGLVSRKDIEEARKYDAELAGTGAGASGNIVGTVAALAPTAFIPGANTLAGAAAIGAGSGLLAPSASTGETLTNVALGGTLAPAAVGAIRAVPALAQGAQALVDPFTARGQARIAGRTLERFAGGPERARQAAAELAAYQPPVAGIQPTVGEATSNAGLAQLERAIRNNPDVAAQFNEQLAGNRAALLQGLQGVAGDEAQMAAAIQAREAAAAPLYAASRAQNILPDQEFAALAQRPAMQQAIQRAQALAAETGQPLTPGQFMHNLKLALDDMLETGPRQGIGAAEARTIRGTRDQFLNWLERQSPEYGQAREAYRAGSAPINQMEIGQELVNRFQPALADFGTATRTTPGAYAAALRNADATAARATGRPGTTLADVLTPQQLQTVTGVAQQLARRANADELGRAVGSNTAQNLVSQNILRQTLGPLGLPESVSENALLSTLMRFPQFVAQIGEQRVLNRLAQAAMNPQEAAALLNNLPPESLALIGAQRLQPFAASLAVPGPVYSGQ